MAGFLAVEFRQRALQNKNHSATPENPHATPASAESSEASGMFESAEEQHSDQIQTEDNTSGQTSHVYQNDAMCLDDDVWMTSF